MDSANFASAEENQKKALYFLQITKEKLNSNSMKILKCLLFHILRTSKVGRLCIEVYFDENVETGFGPAPFQDSFGLILKLLVNGYNLLEPEHSNNFPLTDIQILFPQVFGSSSILLSDASISHVFFNAATQPELVYSKLNERECDQTLPPIDPANIVDIQTIRNQAMVFAVEMEYIRDNFFMDTMENSVAAQYRLFHYEMTCVGGTFDHIHLGHKLLLTQACLLTSKKILVGVTSNSILAKKAYSELIQPYEVRKQRVIDFLKSINPRLEVEIFELFDPVGVTDKIPELQASILTREVEKGGHLVNEARRKVGMKEVDLVFVDMILADAAKDQDPTFSNKTSSSTIREFMANRTKAIADAAKTF